MVMTPASLHAEAVGRPSGTPVDLASACKGEEHSVPHCGTGTGISHQFSGPACCECDT